MKKKEFSIGEGNVFADLGIKESEEMLVKAELARKINALIEQKELTQVAAAELLDIDQPKISALSKGKLSGFSLERLFRFLNTLGQGIVINIAKAPIKKKPTVAVIFQKNKKSPQRKPASARAPVVFARKK